MYFVLKICTDVHYVSRYMCIYFQNFLKLKSLDLEVTCALCIYVYVYLFSEFFETKKFGFRSFQIKASVELGL